MATLAIIPNIVDLSCVYPKQVSTKWSITYSIVGYTLSTIELHRSAGFQDSSYVIVGSSPVNFSTDTSGNFTVNDLSAGTQNYYKIRAKYTYNSGANEIYSYFSDVKSLILYGTPSKPVITSIASNLPRQVTIGWSSDVSGSSIVALDVSYTNTTSIPVGKYSLTGVLATTPFTLTDISKGAYEFQITAKSRENVLSLISNVSTVNVYEIPSKPTWNPDDITNEGITTVRVPFTCADNGGQTVTTAIYTYIPAYNGLTYTLSAPVVNNSFVLDFGGSLTSNYSKIYGNTYNIQFKLQNSQGESLYSDAKNYMPSTVPDQPKQISIILIDGTTKQNGNGTNYMDCSAIVYFTSDFNGKPITETSGNVTYSSGTTFFSFSQVPVLSSGRDCSFILTSSLTPLKSTANYNLQFKCKNVNGDSVFSSTVSIYIDYPNISSNSISVSDIEQSPNGDYISIKFSIDKTNLVFQSYDKLYYEYRKYPFPTREDGSGQVILNNDNSEFSISSGDFSGNIVKFTFKKQTAGVLSAPYNLIVYCIPPTSPFISILPFENNILLTYYTNTTSPITKIQYVLNDTENGTIDFPTSNPVVIPLQYISNVSATQSYKLIAYFTNQFGTSVASNTSYINNSTTIEYQQNVSTCRILGLTPETRFEVISPYDTTSYTSQELNARRKYEILQYFGNTPTTNFVNKLTNKQRYALASRGSFAKGDEVASGAIYNDFTCNVMPAGFFDIPLYNYKINRTYNLNTNYPLPKMWYMNYGKNVVIEPKTLTEIATVYVNKYINSQISDINVTTSLFLNLVGPVNQYGSSITYTVSSYTKELWEATTTTVGGVSQTTMTSVKQYPSQACNLSFTFIPSLGFPSIFHIQTYLGELNDTLIGVSTSVGKLYSIRYTFEITVNPIPSSPGSSSQGINYTIISAGRSVL